MSGPPSGRVPVTSIDSPPPQRKISSRPVVKVTLPERPGDAVTIVDKDAKIRMLSETGMVSKRFRPGERTVYFKSELYEDGILEIGDRVPTPEPAW